MTGIYNNRSYDVNPTAIRLYTASKQDAICGIYGISGLYRSIGDSGACMYIGSAINIKKRIGSHYSALNGDYHDNPILQNSWNIRGRDEYIVFILEECSSGVRIQREQEWMDLYYNSYGEECLYNCVKTPIHPCPHSWTEEQRYRQSISRRGLWSGELNPFYSSARSGELNPFHGKTHEEETKLHLSECAKKRHEAGIHPRKGARLTEEHKEILRQAHLGTTHGPVARAKLSKFFKGRPNPKNKVPVKQINLITGEVVRIWAGATDAQIVLKIDRSSISRCCKKKVCRGLETKSAGGFKWEYATKEEYENSLRNTIKR